MGSGPFFIFKSTQAPHFGIFLLNSKGSDNLCEYIYDDMDIQFADPYVMMRQASGEIIGIWFSDSKEGSRLAAHLTNLATPAGREAALKEFAAAPAPQQYVPQPLALALCLTMCPDPLPP